MYEEVRRNTTSDIRHNIENILRGYYIKYDKLLELMPQAFNMYQSRSNYIDIYIDIYDMLKPVYKQQVYADKQLTIVSSIVNLAAHFRWYFRKCHNMNTRIFLVYADNTINTHARYLPTFGDGIINMISYPNNKKIIDTNLDLTKIIVAYLNDIYLVVRHTMFPMFVMGNIPSSVNPVLVVSKNKMAYQLPALYPNVVLLRPKKSKGNDESFAVTHTNCIRMNYDSISSARTIDYMAKIHPSLLSLLSTLTGAYKYGVNSVINATTAIRLVHDGIMAYKINNAHSADIKSTYYALEEISRFVDVNSAISRFNAIDLLNNFMIYKNLPEYLDDTWNINLYDPEAVKDINNRYFYDNPLQILSL